MKNRGLNLALEKEHRSDEDWIFGASSPVCIAAIPEEDRLKYLPPGEVQIGKDDMMDCASRGPVNILETKFTWLITDEGKISAGNKEWLEDKDFIKDGRIEFSDAFIAIKSGTTRAGNSLKAPLQAIHDNGLIPKHLMPLESWMTFDDYHDPQRIKAEHDALGQEFLSRFPVNYEIVDEKNFGILYKEDMLDMAGYAWPEPVNGIYPATEGQPNHVFVGVKTPKHTIFDNYIDVVDGDFIKVLAPDYDLLDYGYRVFVSENDKPKPIKKKSI